MSSTENPDPERDERIDSAWRATSRDEPPAALDELIRAAARREVGAGPLRSRQPAWLRALPSLAAAAAVAVVAVGIVQLAPPEQVTPMPTTAARGDASYHLSDLTRRGEAGRARRIAGEGGTLVVRSASSGKPARQGGAAARFIGRIATAPIDECDAILARTIRINATDNATCNAACFCVGHPAHCFCVGCCVSKSGAVGSSCAQLTGPPAGAS